MGDGDPNSAAVTAERPPAGGSLISRLQRRLGIDFIDDLRLAPRFLSVRFGALAVLVQGLLETWPEYILSLWNQLPAAVTATLPERIVFAVPILLMIASLVGRLIKQRSPDA